MPKDKDPKEDKKNFGDGEELASDEVSGLLRSFYKPMESKLKNPHKMQEFTEFFEAIEQKIQDTEAINQISKVNKKIQMDYELREKKLKSLVNRLDDENQPKKKFKEVKLPRTHKKSAVNYSRLVFSSVIVLLLVGLACIATFQYSTNYNYLVIEDKEIDWSKLNLTVEQKKQLEQIKNQWLSFQKDEAALIEDRKQKMNEELVKDKPNIALIDKYQREILDHEINIRREKANVFLEKRFVLNEEQTMKLLKLIRG
jgi:hypothetical protein